MASKMWLIVENVMMFLTSFYPELKFMMPSCCSFSSDIYTFYFSPVKHKWRILGQIIPFAVAIRFCLIVILKNK